MKSWQSILKENTFLDDEFTLEKNNSNYIVDGVIKSYEDVNVFLDYTVTKLILDGAHNAGYRLQTKDVENNKIHVLIKEYKSNAIIFEFINYQQELLKCYVVEGNTLNIVNDATKILTQFPAIYKNFDFVGDLTSLNVNIDSKLLIDDSSYINFGFKTDYTVFFKFMFLFMKSMVDKLNNTGDSKPTPVQFIQPEIENISDIIDVMTISVDDSKSELVKNFVNALGRVKTKFDLDMVYSGNYNESENEYTISINTENKEEVSNILVKLCDTLKIEADKLNMKYDHSHARMSQRFIRTITLK